MPGYAYVLIGVGVLMGVLLGVVATRPGDVSGGAEGGGGGPGVVFGLINDFHVWGKWSPWERLDPNMKITYEGAAVGVGSVRNWVGNKKAGEGRMTMLESVANESVTIRLEFFKPFKGTNVTVFRLTPVEGGTQVQWAMEGKNNFMGKAFCMFMNMDKLVGGDFERGLVNLDAAAKEQASSRVG